MAPMSSTIVSAALSDTAKRVARRRARDDFGLSASGRVEAWKPIAIHVLLWRP